MADDDDLKAATWHCAGDPTKPGCPEGGHAVTEVLAGEPCPVCAPPEPGPEGDPETCAVCAESIVEGEDAHHLDPEHGDEVHDSCVEKEDDDVRRMSHEDLVRALRQLRQQNKADQARLDHLDREAMMVGMATGTPVQPLRPNHIMVLAMRINALLDSAFGPIDYKALDDTTKTEVSRLVFEHSFEERLRMVNRRALSDADRRATGLITPPGGLLGPDGRPTDK